MPRRSLASAAGAASRLRFAPSSNNLLVSSWGSGLRLYDAEASVLRFKADSEVLLLDCCFEDESAAFACDSDGSVRRYDFHSGAQDIVGFHEDAVSCIEFSQMTGQVVTASLDKKLLLWDRNASVNHGSNVTLHLDVASLSICGMYILAAVGKDVYTYDMRKLTAPVKENDCPLEYHIRCIQASLDWNGFVAGSVDGGAALKFSQHGTDGFIGYAFRCHPKCRNARSDLVSINSVAIRPWYLFHPQFNPEFPRYPGSVASMAYNHSGQLFAVASTYTYQDLDKVVEEHQIFIETDQDFEGKSLLR
ncbi:hypothetical protein ACP4OV_008222 [Aristida adscensionis]